MTNEELDEKMKNLTLNEVAYLEEQETCKNEHGVYVFISQNGHEQLSLDMVLMDYKNWLVENKKIKIL